MTEPSPLFVSIEDGLKRLPEGVSSRATLYRALGDGSLPGARKLGKRLLLSVADLDRWAAERCEPREGKVPLAEFARRFAISLTEARRLVKRREIAAEMIAGRYFVSAAEIERFAAALPPPTIRTRHRRKAA